MKASVGLGMAAVVLMLAGCGQGDPPVADPPPSTTPTTPTGASSSTTAAALSPEQTVRAWVRAYNKLALTGDDYDITSLSSADCRSCSDLVDPVLAVIKAGGAYKGGRWTVAGTGPSRRGRSRTTAVVSTGVAMAAGATRHRKGQPFHRYGAEHHLLEFHLEREASRWVVTLIVWGS